ncbi:MAG: hypothetical protein JWL90_137, partial [Chthoniobacteraceae bacterium]|nr:hypothetical protein [Chthoniobacteraceae bacterium]
MLPAIPMAQFHTIKRQIRASGTRGAFVVLTISCAALAPFAAAQSSEPLPPAAAIAPSAAELDLSNPDAAVKSFIAALNRADLITAAQCVQGGANGGRSILTARFEQGHPRFAISGVNIAIQGEKATATIAEVNVSVTASPKATAAEDKMKDEQLSLQREGGSWKIVSAKGKEFGRGA